MNPKTSTDAHDLAAQCDIHVPAELVTDDDRWIENHAGGTLYEKGYIESNPPADHMRYQFDDVYENWERGGEYDPDEIGYTIPEDSEIDFVVIRNVIDTFGGEPEIEIDLEPLDDRGVWYTVSRDGQHLIIPYHRHRDPDGFKKGCMSIIREGSFLLAREDADAMDIVSADTDSPIADFDTELQEYLNDVYYEMTTDASGPTWYRDYCKWRKDRVESDDRPDPTQAEKEHYLAQKFEDEYNFLTLSVEEAGVSSRPLYLYDAETGTYQRNGVAFVESQLREYVTTLPTYRWKEVYTRLKAVSPTDPDALNAGEFDEELICVDNGVLDVEEEKLHDHDPKYRFTVSIPVEYDPDASGDAFQEFLAEITDSEEDRRTLEEWVGFTLASGMPLHKFLILVGDGQNGKGVFMEILRDFLGSDNTTGVGLERMTSSSDFGLANLEGKLLNIDGDTSGDDYYGSKLNKLKQLTGEDEIMIERKREQPYTIMNTCKLMFSANQPPRLVDESGNAIPRRLLWVRFPYDFVQDPTEPHEKQARPRDELRDDLLTDESMSGILNVAVEGLQRLLENNCFSNELGSDPEERYQEYMKLADDVAGFESRYIEPATGHGIPTEVTHSVYQAWMDSRDSGKVHNKSTFIRALNKRGGGYWHIGQYTDEDGDRPRAMFGVKFTEEAYQYLNTTQREAVKTLYVRSAKLDADDTPALMYHHPDGESDTTDSEGFQIAPGVSSQDVREYVLKNPETDVYAVMREFELDGDAYDDVQDILENTDSDESSDDDVAQAKRIQMVRDELDERGEVTATELAGELSLDQSTVSATLDKLAEQGDVIYNVVDETEVYRV
ncbi:phage/plasmid primase, P4 family [Natrinema sp. 1APR25-10V2]|uniref:phage/plasmid primase, P4 family n=1 Tax=Natrinema sp. 1APR25-10V2 TaxID=2951081 RepID=UPI0028755E36|nr:phage/plasmid primase, P4 family [Natrinema sp. 1APR25-10V2]MDS0474368.1 phage/plasmid primase, P4 family [Natrinema sp. 1APR25-10V2]